jgi:hypothetical protein
LAGEDDPGIDAKPNAGSYPPNRIAARIDMRHQQIRSAVEQVDRDEKGSA